MNTAARTTRTESAHFYLKDGTPFYEVPYADPSKGMRPATLADARKVGALPSVTTILKSINKPQLNDWITEQSVLAVLSSPRKEGETLDAFVHRVLQVEKVQDQEVDKSRQTGIAIHDAISSALRGEVYPAEYLKYVAPVIAWIRVHGKVVWSEKVVVGDGYAGRADALLDSGPILCLPDFKTTGSLPKKGSWPEHKIQTAMYAAALGNTNGKRIVTANVYISTKEPGMIADFTQDDWAETYVKAAEPMIKLWQWMNQYEPGN